MSEVIESAEVLFVDGKDVPVNHKHADHMVVLRNAADPGGDALYYTPNEWEAFILGVKDGEFDDLAEGLDVADPGASDTQPSGAFPWAGRPAFTVGEQPPA